MNVGHDVMELGINFLGLPGETLGVLAHFQTGGGYAAGVDGLGGSYYEALAHKEEQSFVGGGHIGNFDVVLGAVGQDLLGFLPEEANECETAAGILLAAFDRIPEEGDTVSFTGRDARATFTVADMDRHRVDKILVRVEQIPREDAEE